MPLATKDDRLALATDILGRCQGVDALPHADLHEATGLSRAQLDRRFKATMGVTPRAYRDQQLVLRAQAMLNSQELTIAGIAQQIGFTGGSHFAAWFKRQTGQTPQQWRTGGAD